MSDERHDTEFGLELGRWLKEDAAPMSSRLRASVRDQARATRQLPAHGPREFSRRWAARPSRLELLAAAAVLAVAFLGTLVGLQPPGPGASSSASFQPTRSDSILPAPSASAASLAPSSEPSTAPDVDPFTGSWSTVDGDGSVMLAVFEGTGTSRRITVTDLRATVCAGRSHVVEGTGTVAGAAFEFTGSSGCLGQPLDGPGGTTFTYDLASATLRTPFDWPGVSELTWIRGSLRDAFDGTWTATDTDGSTLTLVMTGSGLTRSVAFEDDAAGPACEGGPSRASGTGTIGTLPDDGRFIALDLAGACVAGASLPRYVAKFGFVLADNTLAGPLAPLEVGGTPRPDTVTWSRP